MESDKVGTLKGYDVVLSISEKAINTGLRALYNHPIATDGGFHPVTPITGGLSPPPSKFAINHDWRIVCNTWEDEDTGEIHLDETTGIWAHIQCPVIELVGKPGENDKATVKITFQRDESSPEAVSKHQSKDSLFYYRKGDPSNPKLATKIINGWTISWQTAIRQVDIMDSMTSILQKHGDDKDPTYLAPGLVKGLKAIDPKLFSVSSIFCLVEDALFVETFDVRDENTQAVSLPVVTAFMNNLSKYWQGMKDAAKGSGDGGAGAGAGAFTPDNPFVLGYSISQPIQSMAQVNPDASYRDTPAFMIPATFDLTTTGNAPQGGLRTLNYCMMTYVSKVPGEQKQSPPRKIDVMADANAGRFPESVFSTVKDTGGNADGVLAWSPNIFWDKIVLGMIAPKTFIEPAIIIKSLFSFRGVDENITWRWNETSGAHASGSGVWERKGTFQTDSYGQPGNSLYGAEMWLDGHSNSQITVSSDLSSAGNSWEPDHARRVYIKASVDFRLVAHFETYAHVVHAPRYRAYEGAVTVRYDQTLTLEPGNGGTWNIVVAGSPATEDAVAGGPKTLQYKDIGDSYPPDGKMGAWLENHEFNHASIFSDSDIQNQLKKAVGLETGLASATLLSNIEAMARQMKTAIMMPGGEVFTFTGMDTGNDLTLFAHINYAIGAEGAQPSK